MINNTLMQLERERKNKILNLKTMTFIPSQYELDRMAAYKESHDE